MIYVYDDGPGENLTDRVNTLINGNRFVASETPRYEGPTIGTSVLAYGRTAASALAKAKLRLARSKPVLTYDESEEK